MSESAPAGTVAKVQNTMVAYGVRLVLGTAMGAIIARALEPTGRGEYSVVVIVATIATIVGHLSVGHANVSFWADAKAAIPGTNLWLSPVLGAVAAIGAWITVAGLGPDVVPVASGWLLLVALGTVPFAVAIVNLTNVTLLLGRVDVVNRSLTISAAVQCAALAALAVADRLSVPVVLWIWALCAVLPLFVILPAVRPFLSQPDVPLARRLLAAGTQYHLGVVATYLLLRVDILILNAMSSAAAVGLYSLAVSIGDLAFAGTEALSLAILPRQAESQLGEARDLTARTVRIASIVAAGSVLALCLAAPLVVPLLYGAPFAPAVPALIALAPGLLAYGSTRALNPYLMRLRRPVTMSALSLSAAALNVVLNIALIPRLGIVGCALATSVSYAGLAIGQIAWFTASSGLPVSALAPRPSDMTLVFGAMLQPLRARIGR